jgi:hypothetical protein
MPKPSESIEPGVQREADREQQIVDLEQTIADRDQAINDRQQNILDEEQIEIYRQTDSSDDVPSNVAVARRQQERLDRSQDALGSHQDAHDSTQEVRDHRQDALDIEEEITVHGRSASNVSGGKYAQGDSDRALAAVQRASLADERAEARRCCRFA